MRLTIPGRQKRHYATSLKPENFHVARRERWRMSVESLDALQLRDSVLAIVAHDIRSPLATITMVASLLEDETLDEQRRRHFLEMIRKASSQIDKLIRDLVGIAQIESGQLAMEKIPTPLHSLLQDVVEAHSQRATGLGITLNLDMKQTDMVVDIDRDRIIELLNNLLSNALKFTSPGGYVSVHCDRTPTYVTIAVEDTGRGITEEQLPHVFERFWQAQHARRAGAGLGLAICKGIVEAHGGDIRVESREGVGSTFSVELPMY
jgi:signal transduction histidine kinase